MATASVTKRLRNTRVTKGLPNTCVSSDVGSVFLRRAQVTFANAGPGSAAPAKAWGAQVDSGSRRSNSYAALARTLAGVGQEPCLGQRSALHLLGLWPIRRRRVDRDARHRPVGGRSVHGVLCRGGARKRSPHPRNTRSAGSSSPPKSQGHLERRSARVTIPARWPSRASALPSGRIRAGASFRGPSARAPRRALSEGRAAVTRCGRPGGRGTARARCGCGT
jgi:hypothetical protein